MPSMFSQNEAASELLEDLQVSCFKLCWKWLEGGREAELAAEVRDLKLLVADLSARVRKLELEQESFKEFELVPSSAAGSTEPVPQASEVAYPAPTERAKILIGVGKWIQDRVRGLGRGLSGREKIPQQSRIYLLFKDFDGKVYNPARLFFRWRDLEPLVKRPTGDSRQDSGTSVYIGLPNQEALVYTGTGETIYEYPVGYLSVEQGGGHSILVDIIFISKVQNRLLVAVPLSAWHRQVPRRKLPPGALSKAVALGVAGCTSDFRHQASESSTVKVWVGYLKAELEEKVFFESPGEPGESEKVQFEQDGGGEACLPFAEALVVVADEKFSFCSAVSQESASEERLRKLEDGMALIQASLQQLAKNGPAATSGDSRPKAAAAPKPETRTVQSLRGLDPGVVQSARSAGIPEAHLFQMASLVRKKNPGLGDHPKQTAREDALGEPIEEEEGEEQDEPGFAGGPGGSMEKALIKLTDIVSLLAKQKNKKASLEELLDESGSTGEALSSGSSRKHSAILKALRKALVENPEQIYQSIRANMLEDFHSRVGGPGEAEGSGTFCGWLEHRSRIPNIQSSVRVAWSVGGALDALESGQVSECKARLALLIAQLDQVAYDHGQWLIAHEAGLEATSPPFSAFSRHLLPAANESQFTRLLDARWVEAFVQKVKEVEEYTDRRNRLVKPKSALNEELGNQLEKPPKTPKGGKGKDAQKGSGRGRLDLPAAGRVDHEPAVHAQQPGAAASTVEASSWWNSSLRVALKGGTKFSIFLRTLLKVATPASEKEATGKPWPMPVPYPAVWRREAGDHELEDFSFKRAVNMMVASLNWMFLRRPPVAPACIRVGTKLSNMQWRVVRELERLSFSWKRKTVTAVDMGRTASKIEALENAVRFLTSLNTEGSDLIFENDPFTPLPRRGYGKLPSFRDLRPGLRHAFGGDVIGNAGTSGQSVTAKAIVADRIKFRGTPSFDPSPYLDRRGEAIFNRPLDMALTPEDVGVDLPKVKIHASRTERDRLLHLLDAGNRLGCVGGSTALRGYQAGLFAVGKDLTTDRLIFDSRPFNTLERAEDFKGEKYVYASLATLAMGDACAVEIAQTAHVALLVQSGLLHENNMLAMNMCCPRSPSMIGVVIDDLIALELVAKETFEAGVSCKGGEAIESMLGRYIDAGLTPHEKKTFKDQLLGEYWGASVDGQEGLVKASLSRALPIFAITSAVVAMGVTNLGLLEILVGSWTSIFLFRRRLLSLFSVVYEPLQRGLKRQHVIKLSDELRDELVMIISLGPLACTDLRCWNSPLIYCSDASDWGIGITKAALPSGFEAEVHRHRLRKPVWTKLLSPLRRLQRLKGVLPPAEELPDGQLLPGHPLWLALAGSLEYTEVYRRKAARDTHINILELRGRSWMLDKGSGILKDFRHLRSFGLKWDLSKVEKTSQGPGVEIRLAFSDAMTLLLNFSEDRFEWNRQLGTLPEVLQQYPGFLDLYSGARGIPKVMVSSAPCWVLCFDNKTDPDQDLLDPAVQRVVLRLLRGRDLSYRAAVSLDEVLLVEPATAQLGQRVHTAFLEWVSSNLSSDSAESLLGCPETLGELVRLFGVYMFESMQSLYMYKQLITFLQRERPGLRAHFGGAWQTVSRWEICEPAVHRTPLPYGIFQAMIAVGLVWGWWRWAACTALAFFGMCRPGEVLRAFREDLLLPSDLLGEEINSIFLTIRSPKTRRRGGGRVQHAKVQDPIGSLLCASVFGPLSLVREYRRAADISGLMWRMRLRSFSTLERYLQEVGADSVYVQLDLVHILELRFEQPVLCTSQLSILYVRTRDCDRASLQSAGVLFLCTRWGRPAMKAAPDVFSSQQRQLSRGGRFLRHQLSNSSRHFSLLSRGC
ncbi:unnamed protein product [Symbiodinium necroappetens]|uniref:Uncharacterized protein n=1 Tax=Symbiodinium necroappetens TaxID=1628268 RepID=A0A812KD09_9DINO|nr:unnamed protein product [Symbiodinium necroappetens]